MTGSAALDILIGLFTLYFVMSTLSSASVELIGNYLEARASMLNAFLKFQFIESSKPESNLKVRADLDVLYKSLSSKQVDNQEENNNLKCLAGAKAENFTRALYDAIGFTGNEKFNIPATIDKINKNFESHLL